MKITSRNDAWGGVILELRGESTHENTLLQLLAIKRMAEHGISEMGTMEICLSLTFREYEPIGKAIVPASKVTKEAI